MNKARFFIRYLPLLGGILAGVGISFHAVKGSAELKTAIGSDVTARELRAITVESWDRDFTSRGYAWEAYTNFDDVKAVAKPEDYNPSWTGPQSERHVKLIKGTPQDIKENLSNENAYLFGLKFAFTFPGHNVVTIQPPSNIDQYTVERPRPYLSDMALTGQAPPPTPCYKEAGLSMINTNSARPQVVDCVTGIELPGIVKAVSLWINGRGQEYDLEGWIEDYKGDTHILQFGSLNFVGWRPLTANIPVYIPQDFNEYPQGKNLILKKFKIRARPNARVDTVYLFFDEIRVLTDVFDVHFDGAQIDFDKADCYKKQRILELMRKNARNPELFPLPKDCNKAPGPVAPIPAISAGKSSGGGAAPAAPKGQAQPQ